ncbi:MAG: lipoate--protein ligase family protein [Candidatus Methanofastidiosa archaeon]|nr:lipoate--protein ligase family protein [Candidatus Methanofastidiosa archaeon]
MIPFKIGRIRMTIFEYKPLGGKLIGISFNYMNGLFSDVMIYGDFFVFPEESIEDLERTIEGKNLSELLGIIENFFSSDVEVYGIRKEDLEEAFKRAINER